MQRLKLFKECFENISIKELNRRIEYYRMSVARRTPDEKIIRKELRQIFSSFIENKKMIFFLNYDTITLKYQLFHFFRIRKFTKDDYHALENYNENQKINFPSMVSEQDAWWPPVRIISDYGRLNRPKESVLYLSNELTNAIYETRCKNGECFFVMVYNSRRQIRISQLHTVPYMEELTELENAKRIMMHNFLINEFREC